MQSVRYIYIYIYMYHSSICTMTRPCTAKCDIPVCSVCHVSRDSLTDTQPA
jgi:hypothetical protein